MNAAATDVLARLAAVSDDFAADRAERQRRRHLDKLDFDAIASTGFLEFGVPVSQGGRFESIPATTRPIAESLRTLAHGDSSVALVSSMHYSVLVFWLMTPRASQPERQDDWDEQRSWAFQSALDGHWWGTCTSEPGSGGDVLATKTIATPTDDPATYRISGDKHFGSGTGICSYMITTALPSDRATAAGSPPPGFFVLDMRDQPWERDDGVSIIAPWDGHGMTATQSHGLRFTDRAVTHGFGIDLPTVGPGSAAGVCCFVAVVLGIVENAMSEAKRVLRGRASSLRPLEQVEWVNACNDAFLLAQAYEGALRATETGTDAMLAAYQAKTVGADLAESCLARISRVVGGSSFNRNSPLGFWAEDVRALGFLRPPWALAHDTIHQLSLM